MGGGTSQLMATFIVPIWRGEYDAPLKNMHPAFRDKVDPPYFEAALAQLHLALGDCGGTVCMHIKEGVRTRDGLNLRDEARVLKFSNGRKIHFRLEWIKGRLSAVSIAAVDGIPLDLRPARLLSTDLYVHQGVELLAAWYRAEDVTPLLHPTLVDAIGGIERLREIQLSDSKNPDFGVVVSIEPEAPTTELSVEDDDVPRLDLTFLVQRESSLQHVAVAWTFPAWKGEVTALSLLTPAPSDTASSAHPEWRTRQPSTLAHPR
eukprot:EG_transcript_13853